MNFNTLISLIAPSGIIVAGVLIKLSRDKEKFGVFAKYWYLFILVGGMLLMLRIVNLLFLS
ncbi:hypothetical protein [Flavobacterium tructae]|uniref:hypothetical protein n=1 Tax=Flavobacterium tructae TaxID=1114873 RepID=UPI0035A9734C